MALQPPPRHFARLTLPTVTVAAASLYRITRHSGGEPYFGRSGNNRFDDPSFPKKKRFGTCYFGFEPKTAFAETLLHDEIAVNGQFVISYADFAGRFMVRFDGGDFVLANLTGETLKILGGDGSISTELPAHTPRRWSRVVYAHPRGVDGIVYVSRHLNDRKAVVLFDRAGKRLRPRSYSPLPKVRIRAVLTDLHGSLRHP